MEFKFTADQAREAVTAAHVPYTPEEVYEKIERLARSGQTRAVFSGDRWSDELTEVLEGDGYSLRVARPIALSGVVYVAWGPPSSRRLREGGGNDE